MKLKYILPIVAFLIALGCVVAYQLIGSEIAEDGTLIEPFWLIPMAWFFLFFGLGSLVLAILKKKYHV